MDRSARLVSKSTASAPAFAQTNCYSNVSDGAILPWYGAPVTAGQPVTTSAAEAAGARPSAEFIGDAHIYTETVAVVNSAVLVRVHTGWGAPLDLCLHYVG